MKNNIRQLRGDRGITIKQLAEMTGQHFTTVHRHQNGSTNIPMPKMRRYAEIFGVKIADIMVGGKAS